MPLANVCMGIGGKGLIVGWVVETAKSKNGTTQIAEFRVAMISTYPQCVNIPLQGLDRHVLTVGAILGLHRQIRAFHWHHLTNHKFTWLAESILEKQTG